MFYIYLISIFICSIVYSTLTDHYRDHTLFTIHAVDEKWIKRQEDISYIEIKKNINPPGTLRGFFAASLSTSYPDYFYTWTRDAALVSRVLVSLTDHDTVDILLDYVDFQINVQNTSTVCDCLGEPKYNHDGTGYTGSWGRPQNDGPAERAITFMLFANRWRKVGGDEEYVSRVLIPAIIRDIDYIVSVWNKPCYDLWEEVEGIHFFTLMVMRRALLDGADFLEDEHRENVYLLTSKEIETRIESFWLPNKNYITVTQDIRNGVDKASGLDVSTLIAANMNNRNDGFFTSGSDKVLATAVRLEEVFASLYPLNEDRDDRLGVSIGRYPEDIYDGYGLSLGNPWFLATLAYAELYYLAIDEWKQNNIFINSINQPFFEHILRDDFIVPIGAVYTPESPIFHRIISKTKYAADKFLTTVEYHQHRNGSMSEQFDRYIGFMTGARDLTWSHAAFLSAARTRRGLHVK
ncbi:Six-hairpin glycosidase-like protein [Pilobolus umbonatus]|nr:Six-hairpin glycosidase-like protein [Pilobolus umbonatus]